MLLCIFTIRLYKKLRGFDVIVNNASIKPTSPIEAITQEQFNKVCQINVGSALWDIQAGSDSEIMTRQTLIIDGDMQFH